jgi:cytochrome P450/nitrite reductase/ring-hydroxylating ferredoxin subunit
MHDTQIATIAELTQERLIGAHVAGVDLVAILNEGSVTIFEGHCPHQGTLLSEGLVENGRLICRAHGWRFECASGRKVDNDETYLHQFSAVIDDGRVLIDQAEVKAWALERGKKKEPSATQPVLTPDQLPGPRSLPLLGNLHQIKTEKFHLILEDWFRQFGDLFQFKLGAQRAVVIAAPEMMQQILRQRPETFSRLPSIRQTIEEMGIEGLFSAEGEQWRRHRHFAQATFDARHLRSFFPVMAKVTQRLYSRWQHLAELHAPIDVQQELMRYTVDITANLAFGYDMNTLEAEGDRIQQHLEHIFPMIAYRAFMPVRHWNYLKLPADRTLETSLAELRVSVNHFIDNARRQVAENPVLRQHPQNLLQALLAAQADENVELSDREIYGNVFTFLLAGEDTTANSIAWIMYFMGTYPDVQRLMQEEADSVLMDAAIATAHDRLSELRYIEAVAHETMRLKPVATFLALEALTDVTIGRLQIPQATPVFLLLRPKALEDSEFAEAVEFKPERWLDYPTNDNPHQRKSFLPFGAGPRLCPGRSLALLEIKMAAAMVCHNFEVLLAEPGRTIEERFVFTMMPQDLMMVLRRRSAEAAHKL